jgi:4-hydroxy-4-methyl-2-oxoglutarate aldolase
MSAPAEILASQFAAIGTATIHEAMGKRGQFDPSIRAMWPGARVCGQARPVVCQPADNLMVHWALATAQPGEVLVIGTGGFPEAGYWGFITTTAARVAGVAGVIIDGCIRDLDQIAEARFPVFARGTALQGTTKVGVGACDRPVVVGGQVVAPGDLVIGDADGLVVVPAGEADAVLAACRERDAAEVVMLQRLEAGERTIDVLGLRDLMADRGMLPAAEGAS